MLYETYQNLGKCVAQFFSSKDELDKYAGGVEILAVNSDYHKICSHQNILMPLVIACKDMASRLGEDIASSLKEIGGDNSKVIINALNQISEIFVQCDKYKNCIKCRYKTCKIQDVNEAESLVLAYYGSLVLLYYLLKKTGYNTIKQYCKGTLVPEEVYLSYIGHILPIVWIQISPFINANGNKNNY